MADLAAALPEYELLGELGRGAMGVVLLARHRSLGRPVAIKELPSSFAADASVRTRFLNEARTVAGLSHPHIVSVYDFVDRDGHLALIMEQLPGGTVWDRFTVRGVTAPVACALLLSTAAGLDHAHRHGVLHRDVKPENLMFTAEGQLKVTDFGMAKVMGGEKTLATAEGVVLGTPAYMAPEQAEGATVGPPADVYACGTMLYELISGRLPFASAPTPMAMLVRRIAHDPPPLLEVAPNAAPEIARVIDRAISREIEDRYRDVKEFAVALGSAAVRSWSDDWLAATGVRVTGSLAIEEAARGGYVSDPVDVDIDAQGPDADSRSSGRPGSGPAPATVLDPPGSPDSPEVAEPPIAAEPPLAADSVVAVDPRRQAAVDLSQVSIGQIVDIAEVSKPAPSPTVPALISVTLALLLAVGAFVGAEYADVIGVEGAGVEGAGVDGSRVDGVEAVVSGANVNGQAAPGEAAVVDFSQPVVVDGLGSGSQVRLEASMLGIPLGVSEAALAGGRAEFSSTYLRWTTAGRVDLALVVDGEAEPRTTLAATATHPWYTTAPFALAVIVGLFALASVQANVRGLRGRRSRFSAFVGLVVSGALVGAAVVLVAVMARGLSTTVPLLAIGAALAAGSSIMLGVANRRRRRPAGFTVMLG